MRLDCGQSYTLLVLWLLGFRILLNVRWAIALGFVTATLLASLTTYLTRNKLDGFADNSLLVGCVTGCITLFFTSIVGLALDWGWWCVLLGPILQVIVAIVVIMVVMFVSKLWHTKHDGKFS
tara:strand:- start:288 stop:653 length:366 start_codon:yes stop_codon:yes gene_type:complete